MVQKDYSKTDNGIEVFDLLLTLWRNKFLFLFLGLISFALGLTYFYMNPIQSDGRYHTTINLLIEDYVEEEEFYQDIDSYQRYSKNTIVGLINKNLLSSYNYEKWSYENEELTKYLPQADAIMIEIDVDKHTIKSEFVNLKTFEAIKSYIEYTSKKVSNKILDSNTKLRNLMITEIEQEILILQKFHEDRIADFEYELLNKNSFLEASKTELNFINEIVASSNKDNIRPEILMRKFELENSIRITELLIENIGSKKGGYRSLESDLAEQLSRLETKKKKVQSDINKKFHFDIVSLGRTTQTFIPPNLTNLKAVLVVSLVCSFFISFIIIIVKDEYKRRKENE